ncbi:MAG: hypothetical protein NTX43_04565 [Bacteroidetes bacterium]|nr:hypothetical protein [Bacteroidota bacterium]
MKKTLVYLLIAFIGFAFACRKTNNPPPVPFTTFKVNGTPLTYYNYSRFCKDFCGSSTFCGTFDLADNILPAELLKIGLPGNPVTGQVFKSGDYRFVFTYVDASQTWFNISGGSLKLTINKWEGQGGWAIGSFSGTLKASDTDSVNITEGYFQNWIWTTIKNK